jgi:hypothetical protein
MGSIKDGEFADQLSDHWILKQHVVAWSWLCSSSQQPLPEQIF